jgi:hypothetical protein
MAILNPAPAQLGLASPAVGPWFDDNNLRLAVPGPLLSVPHTFQASGNSGSTKWFPPANGTLTLAISTPQRPAALLGLTDALGAPAFSNDVLVALFKLLPEVEDRLEVLTAMLPRPDAGAVNGRRTRARVRSIAMEFPDRDPSRLAYFYHPSANPTAEDFGLLENGGVLNNGSLAMTDLKQPGQFVPFNRQLLATIPDGTTVQVWAFDADGFAIDPGAVAAWWAAIAGGSVAPWNPPPNTLDISNMWANALITRTCAVADHLGFRIVNPHRGVIDGNVRGRLTSPPTNGTQVSGNPDLYTASQTANAGTTVSFTSAPTGNAPDTVPIPMAALLPIGNYGAAVTLWQNGPVTIPAHITGNLTLARDYVEVAVLDVESFVCGTVRGPSNNTGTSAARRSSDQNRASTRINVTRSTVALLPTIDSSAGVAGVANAFNALPDGVNPVSIIAPAYDHDWGGRTVANLPAGPPALPNVLPPLQCFALVGGGEAQGDAVGEQQVVIRLTVQNNAVFAGAWVRIYPQKINLDTGRREPQPGGAGRFGNAAATGNQLNAHVVVTLPPGRTDGTAQLGVDVMIVPGVTPPTPPPGNVMLPPLVYADQRITRPDPVGGTPVAFGNIASNARVLDCDQGVEFTPAGIPQGAFASGSTLVARVPGASGDLDAFTAIDRSTVPLQWFDNQTLARTLTANDVIAVTTPAFVDELRGDTNPNDTAGATGFNPQVRIQPRNGILSLGTAGAPLPSQERLELVGLRNAGSAAGAANIAVVGSAPALATWHELLPAQAGNPTAPGGKEVHGAGVQITGGAITDVADFMRDRLFPATDALVADAGTNALPTQTIAAPAQWAAVLKTVARGVEGEALVFEALDLVDRTLFDTYDAIAAAIPNLPPIGTIGNINAAMRAACRRVLNALGRQEALFALNAAIARAERLIYIETPAIDSEAVDADGAQLAWLDTLTARLTARPGLHVALCVPRELLPGTPAPSNWVRNECWHAALAELLEAGGGRVAVFSPGAGPFSHVRMASTVVVVDDVWALVGNTHLWRRGLSFDSSLAVAVFDEANLFGRGAAVSAFRVQLAADRLGVANTQIPLVGHEFVGSLRRLADGGGAGRLALGAIPRASVLERPTATDMLLWNRDGSLSADTDLLLEWLTLVEGYASTG